MLLLLTPLSLRASWQFEKELAGVEVWKSSDFPNSRILVENKKTEAEHDVNFFKTQEFKETLQESKKKTLSFFGVNEWNVNIDNVEKTPHGIVVDFSGDYKDNKKRKTYYKEQHIYAKDKMTQALFTTNSPQLKKRFKIAEFIKNRREKLR